MLGDKEVDGRSDLYSVGVVAYRMLCGRLPFEGGNTATLLVKQLSEAPVPLRTRCPSVPEGLASIVMRLLAKSPNDRYPDAESLQRALDDNAANPLRAVAGQVPSGRPVPPPASASAANPTTAPAAPSAAWTFSIGAPAPPGSDPSRPIPIPAPSQYRQLPPLPYVSDSTASRVLEAVEHGMSRRECGACAARTAETGKGRKAG